MDTLLFDNIFVANCVTFKKMLFRDGDNLIQFYFLEKLHYLRLLYVYQYDSQINSQEIYTFPIRS